MRERRPALALNPATPVDELRDILGDLDYVLLMSVNPGFGGQQFIQSTVDKIRQLVALCAELKARPIIEVDGGINSLTGALVAEAGARMLVAGNAVFCEPDPVAAMRAIREAAELAV